MPSCFDDRAQPPDDDALRAALARTKPAWDRIVADLAARAGVACEWKFYGAKHGWQLKATRGKRAALYLVPGRGTFVAALALPDAALPTLRDRGLPEALVAEIEAGKRSSEGWPARVEVRTLADAAIVSQLLDTKLAG